MIGNEHLHSGCPRLLLARPCTQDHLLYLRLKELGLATEANTFTPTYPDEDTLVSSSRQYPTTTNTTTTTARMPLSVSSATCVPMHNSGLARIKAHRHLQSLALLFNFAYAIYPVDAMGNGSIPQSGSSHAYELTSPLRMQALSHDRLYVQSFLDGTIPKDEMRKINLPWSAELRQRTLIGTGSAILAAQLALQWGVACMCNGGTHHAHRGHGGGWCIFNDQAGGSCHGSPSNATSYGGWVAGLLGADMYQLAITYQNDTGH